MKSKKFLIMIFSIICLLYSNVTYALIADHSVISEFENIPNSFFDEFKNNYNIFYGHTSHGSQIITGIQMLENENSIYESPNFHEISDDLGHNGDVTWVSITEDFLDNPSNSEYNTVMWSWCGGVSDNSESGINTYLNAMNQLEQDYPEIIFVYMTGHLDGSGEDGNLRIRNQQIRDYAIENDKILFDFEDIESFDPDGNYYPDESDSCGWCSVWCSSNDCSSCSSCAHSHCFNCYQKGKAFWWMALEISNIEENNPDEDSCLEENILCVDDETGNTQEYDDIQESLDDAIAGDTVLIHSGTYYPSSRLEVRASGTINNPITIRGIENPIIDGNENLNDVFNVEFYDNIIIEDLEIINAARAGIRLTHSDNSIIRNNNLHDNYRWQIFTSFCDDILIEGNECYGSTDEHGIYFSNSGDNPIIRNNIIHDNNMNGLHMNGDINSDSTTYHDVDGIISNALVENNIIYGNGANGGSAINCDGVQDSIIKNNLVYDQHSSGISLYQIDGGEISINNEVFHNTIVIADDGRWPLNMKDGSSANTVYNNIFLTQHSSYGSIALEGISGIDINYNILTTNEDVVTPDDDASYMNLPEWQAQGHDLNSYAAEITDIFVDFPNDFRLKDSVAVDTGFDVGVNNDILNNVRPFGNGFDIGAYESGYFNPNPNPEPELEQCTNADENEDGVISNEEMDGYIVLWLSGDVDLSDLFDAIDKWKNDCES
jgi:parallel beta-helix repeat protein